MLIEKLLVAFLLGVIYVIVSKDYPVLSNLCKNNNLKILTNLIVRFFNLI